MCRNITELRGLEPPATDDEVEAAARQFIRKVSGLPRPPSGAEDAYEQAIARVTAEVHGLLDALPARRGPAPRFRRCAARRSERASPPARQRQERSPLCDDQGKFGIKEDCLDPKLSLIAVLRVVSAGGRASRSAGHVR